MKGRIAKADLDFPCVYFLYQPFGNLVKIGTTQHHTRRIKALCYNSNTPLFELCGECIPSSRHRRKREKELHEIFKKFRVHGEWFVVQDELLDYLLPHMARNRHLQRIFQEELSKYFRVYEGTGERA